MKKKNKGISRRSFLKAATYPPGPAPIIAIFIAIIYAMPPSFIILIDEHFIHLFTRNLQFGKLNGTIVCISNIVPLERKARICFNNPKI
jgi:hypothetical protein